MTLPSNLIGSSDNPLFFIRGMIDELRSFQKRKITETSLCDRCLAVGSVLIHRRHLLRFTQATNYPQNGWACTGEKGACGCIHVETQLIQNCLIHHHCDEAILCVSASPCHPCVTQILNAQKLWKQTYRLPLFRAVCFFDFAPHWKDALSLLKFNIPTFSLEDLEEIDRTFS